MSRRFATSLPTKYELTSRHLSLPKCLHIMESLSENAQAPPTRATSPLLPHSVADLTAVSAIERLHARCESRRPEWYVIFDHHYVLEKLLVNSEARYREVTPWRRGLQEMKSSVIH